MSLSHLPDVLIVERSRQVQLPFANGSSPFKGEVGLLRANVSVLTGAMTVNWMFSSWSSKRSSLARPFSTTSPMGIVNCH